MERLRGRTDVCSAARYLSEVPGRSFDPLVRPSVDQPVLRQHELLLLGLTAQVHSILCESRPNSPLVCWTQDLDLSHSHLLTRTPGVEQEDKLSQAGLLAVLVQSERVEADGGVWRGADGHRDGVSRGTVRDGRTPRRVHSGVLQSEGDLGVRLRPG